LNKVKLNPDDVTYEKIVDTNRVAKVVKGGRNFSFNAIVVVGNQQGVVGVGTGKANEITDAIRKAKNKAVINAFRVPIVKGTIPHEVNAKYGPSKILVKPATPGTGLIAGGTPRALFEAAGIQNILAKSMGSNTPCNLVKACIVALTELRTLSQVAKMRGKTFDQLRDIPSNPAEQNNEEIDTTSSPNHKKKKIEKETSPEHFEIDQNVASLSSTPPIEDMLNEEVNNET